MGFVGICWLWTLQLTGSAGPPIMGCGASAEVGDGVSVISVFGAMVSIFYFWLMECFDKFLPCLIQGNRKIE